MFVFKKHIKCDLYDIFFENQTELSRLHLHFNLPLLGETIEILNRSRYLKKTDPFKCNQLQFSFKLKTSTIPTVHVGGKKQGLAVKTFS